MLSKKVVTGVVVGIFACLVAITSIGAASPIQGTLWAGIESVPGGYFGGEFVFLPLENLGLEIGFSGENYGSLVTSQSLGVRGIFPAGSVGTGLKLEVFRNPNDAWIQGYVWGSLYGRDYFFKAYLDAARRRNYGQIILSADVRTLLGFTLSYLDSVTPPGEYEETKGDVSFSLLPWSPCRDYDVRIFFGGKISCFVTPDYQRYEWNGVIGGIRILFPRGDFRFELRVPNNYPQNKEGVAISGSIRF